MKLTPNQKWILGIAVGRAFDWGKRYWTSCGGIVLKNGVNGRGIVTVLRSLEKKGLIEMRDCAFRTCFRITDAGLSEYRRREMEND